MKPVYQTIISEGDGDCTRAVYASLLDLTIEQVPHFNRFKEDWWNVLNGFMWTMGYMFEGTGYPKRRGNKHTHSLWKTPHIGGYFAATVPSKTFGEGITHSVIIDRYGIVAHDPNPNKKWLGVNVRESGELRYWNMWAKRKKGKKNVYEKDT